MVTFSGSSDITEILREYDIPSPEHTVSDYKEMGYEIAKPLPYFIMTETTRRQAREIALRMKLGSRTEELHRLKVIGWYGPPGTGKDTLAKEIAACLKMPFVEFDLGQGSDLLEFIGGTGLRASNGATETTAVEGPLTAFARIGSIIAVNEIVNVEGIQLSVLHAMLQERVILLQTAEPQSDLGSRPRTHRAIPVHKDTFFVFTWNPDLRNPDRQMPSPALLDRLRARRFDSDTEEDEAKKLVSMVSFVLDQHFSIEAAKRYVKLIRELRKEYENGRLTRCPYMRTLEDFTLTHLKIDKRAAFDVLLNLCDQDPDEFRQQRDDIILRHFQPIFGTYE